MKKVMKKVALGMTFAFTGLSLFSFTTEKTATAENLAVGGGTTITCPSGDWCKCYEFPNGGGVVYKGREGDTTIQF
jgi:hypothetical protein